MGINVYSFQLIWLLVMAIASRQFFTKEERILHGVPSEKWTWVQVGFVALPYIYLAAVRTDLFGDTASYRTTFKDAPSSFSGLFEYYNTLEKDRGYYMFQAVIKIIVGNHVQIMFAIIAAIQMYAVVRLYKNYSVNFLFSFFLFVATTDYVGWMHNGTRQFLAATIVYLGTDWLLERKYLRVLILILIASTIHLSVLLMIPFLIVIHGRAWNSRTILAIILCILAVAYVATFTDILDVTLESTQYSYVVSDWEMIQDNGTNPLRVLIYSIPAIIAIVGIRWVWIEEDPLINMCVNASMLVSGLYIISMVTSGIFIGRIPIYLSLYSNGILLPWEINMLFEKESAGFIRGLAVILYSAFFYYQMHMAWGLF